LFLYCSHATVETDVWGAVKCLLVVSVLQDLKRTVVQIRAKKKGRRDEEENKREKEESRNNNEAKKM
jgi:hypothetical protein